MSKTLLLIVAFGAVAFAAPGFAPQSNGEDDAPLIEAKIHEKRDADGQNVDVSNIEEVLAASAGSEVNDENTEEKNIAKRQAYISYPYSQYRYGYYPNRYAYYPQQPYYAPAANGVVYPYRNLLSYIPGFSSFY